MFNKLLRQHKAKLESQIKSLTESIDKANSTLAVINSKIDSAKSQEIDFQQKLISSQRRLDEANKELGIAEGLIELENLGYEFTPLPLSPTNLEDKRSDIEIEMSRMVRYKYATSIEQSYTVDGSTSKGERFQEAYGDGLLMTFNVYYEKKKKSITVNNIQKTKDLIRKKYDTLNRKGHILGVIIKRDYLDDCLELLDIELTMKVQKAEEKERVKEERRRLREQEKMLAEAEKAKAELQKERRMYEQSLAHALTQEERDEFEAKLKEIDLREASVDYRLSNSKAGYLYITASKAMPDMTKIGVTRRLNPLVRIDELSSASVPYHFVCYGLVFCDDVFNLESRVHAYFDNKRVNVNNKHKEFFYVTPKEAIEVLQKEFKCEVHFANESEED